MTRNYSELLEHVQERKERAREQYQARDSGTFEQGQALGKFHAMNDLEDYLIEKIEEEHDIAQ